MSTYRYAYWKDKWKEKTWNLRCDEPYSYDLKIWHDQEYEMKPFYSAAELTSDVLNSADWRESYGTPLEHYLRKDGIC